MVRVAHWGTMQRVPARRASTLGCRLVQPPCVAPAPAGLVVAIPAAYFASRGMINGALGRRLALLFLMGGTQGLVGWWMVRSGFRVSLAAGREPAWCGGRDCSSPGTLSVLPRPSRHVAAAAPQLLCER